MAFMPIKQYLYEEEPHDDRDLMKRTAITKTKVPFLLPGSHCPERQNEEMVAS